MEPEKVCHARNRSLGWHHAGRDMRNGSVSCWDTDLNVEIAASGSVTMLLVNRSLHRRMGLTRRCSDVVSWLWSQLEPIAELSDVTWRYTSLTAAAEANMGL